MKWHVFIWLIITWILAGLAGYSMHRFVENGDPWVLGLILPFLVACLAWCFWICWLLRKIQKNLKCLIDAISPDRNCNQCEFTTEDDRCFKKHPERQPGRADFARCCLDFKPMD